MPLTRFLSVGLMTAATLAAALPAVAAPKIASGEITLDTNMNGCLAEVDEFLTMLDVDSSSFDIGRTGFFDDGTFRVLCYPNPYENTDTTLAVIFVAHDTDAEVAGGFVDVALEQLGN